MVMRMGMVMRVMMRYWRLDWLCGAVVHGLTHDGQVKDEGAARPEQISNDRRRISTANPTSVSFDTSSTHHAATTLQPHDKICN